MEVTWLFTWLLVFCSLEVEGVETFFFRECLAGTIIRIG